MVGREIAVAEAAQGEEADDPLIAVEGWQEAHDAGMAAGEAAAGAEALEGGSAGGSSGRACGRYGLPCGYILPVHPAPSAQHA